jgi:MOSC domain-containing protein YiiM
VAHVVSIAYTPRSVERRPTDRYARMPVEWATLVEQRGIAGDLKGSGGSRQLNVMRAETLAELAAEGRKTGPCEMGEQVVIAGLDPAAFTEGTRLQLGDSAVIEVGIPRTGCARFEYIQGMTRQGVAGRLGVLARVVVGGDVAVGDEVAIVTEGMPVERPESEVRKRKAARERPQD